MVCCSRACTDATSTRARPERHAANAATRAAVGAGLVGGAGPRRGSGSLAFLLSGADVLDLCLHLGDIEVDLGLWLDRGAGQPPCVGFGCHLLADASIPTATAAQRRGAHSVASV